MDTPHIWTNLWAGFFWVLPKKLRFFWESGKRGWKPFSTSFLAPWVFRSRVFVRSRLLHLLVSPVEEKYTDTNDDDESLCRWPLFFSRRETAAAAAASTERHHFFRVWRRRRRWRRPHSLSWPCASAGRAIWSTSASGGGGQRRNGTSVRPLLPKFKLPSPPPPPPREMTAATTAAAAAAAFDACALGQMAPRVSQSTKGPLHWEFLWETFFASRITALSFLSNVTHRARCRSELTAK